MSDFLSQLSEATFRGIPFPTSTVGTKGGHSTVPHKKIDQDGWQVENLGRASYQFHLRIPLCDTIAKGPNETWSNLVTAIYPKLIAAFEDRSTGPFNHPYYGIRNCKVLDWDEALDPDWRGGTMLSASLMESFDNGAATGLSKASQVSIAAAAATVLDGATGAMNPPPALGTLPGQSLTDFVKSIGAIGDSVSLFTQQVAGKINSVIAAVTNLGASFGYIPGFSDATNRLISSLHAIQATAATKDKATSIYVVQRATTVASIANRVRSTVPDLLALNPDLARGPIVAKDSVVRFYAR